MNSEPSPARITIEPAQASDLDWCARLMAGSEPWITLRLDLEKCRKVIHRPGGELFVAHAAGQPVGFVLVSPFGFAGSPYITSIGVAAGARSQGVGAQLLTFTENRAAGRRFMFLCVSSFNHRAQDFYRRQGYERVGEIPNYIIEGQSELVFCKELS